MPCPLKLGVLTSKWHLSIQDLGPSLSAADSQIGTNRADNRPIKSFTKTICLRVSRRCSGLLPHLQVTHFFKDIAFIITPLIRM